MRALTLLLLLIVGIVGPAREQTNVIAIVGATVVDGTGAPPFDATVIIRGDRIAEIGAGIAIPSDARVINGSGMTLIPGLFDLHTHLFNSSNGSGTADWPKHLKAYLYCGVTSVVDLSPYPEIYEPVRRLMANGTVTGPRVSLAARVTTPGGHGAEGGRGEVHTREVSSPREARAAIQAVAPYGPDVIKVFSDGWRYGTASDMTSMNEDVLAAIVEEAHKHGIEVVTHTVTLAKAKIAARAGVDAIVHGIGDQEADDELLGLMKMKGTAYAPTLSVYERREQNPSSSILDAVLAPSAEENNAPVTRTVNADQTTPETRAANLSGATQAARARRWQKLIHNAAALKAAGVTLGAGTDAGMPGTHHGWATIHELQLLVAAGLTPLESITAATGNSAKVLNVEHERGTIAFGKLADLVLIEGAPHRNIGDMGRINRVFLGGREIERAQLSREILSPVVSPIPPIKAADLIDDFERVDGRSQLNTLWLETTDSGHDHSKVIIGRTLRRAGDHALSVMAQMSMRARPFVRANVPLSRGAIEPVDVSGFRRVRFEARGEGEYRLIVQTREVRWPTGYFQTTFKADAAWRAVTIEFSALRQENTNTPRPWSGRDVQMLNFEVARKPGEVGWLEIDNLRFGK